MNYEENNAILSIYAGAGGRDAEDWAAMLLRMYQRYVKNKKYQAILLHEHQGQEGGLRNATIEIIGKGAYGELKAESGSHRLVRISPFSSAQLRHTSFALVEVVPEIKKVDAKDIKINLADLKIEFFRSSGPGGQNVNKRETAVRIIHSPTGLVAHCQSERTQERNREKAMDLLYSKLYQLKRAETEKEARLLKPIKISAGVAEWGSQIRSYILHPYKMVRDERTGFKTSQIEKVLEGELDLIKKSK